MFFVSKCPSTFYPYTYPTMLFHCLVFIFCAFIQVGATLVKSGDQVSLELSYEALCPSCQDFITTELAPALDSDLQSIISLKMVPYGNTKYYANNNTYSCQHGVDECTTDVYEQCVEYLISGTIESIQTGDTSYKAFPFILCMEQVEGDPTYGETCFDKSNLKSLGLTWSAIRECSTMRASEMQAEAAKATPTHQYVPWVLINGVLLEHTNLLVPAICNAYTGTNPPSSCKNVHTAAVHPAKTPCVNTN